MPVAPVLGQDPEVLRQQRALPASVGQGVEGADCADDATLGQGGPEDAFAALRTISQRRNIKLRTIAAELVEATRRRSQHTHRKPDQAPQAGAGCPSWAHAALSLSTCVSGVR